MNKLEALKVQLNQVIDAIIAEAKNSAYTSVPPVSSAPIATINLSAQINETFIRLTSQPNKEKNLFSSYVDPLKWTRNVNCWAKSVDLTGFAVCVYGLGGVGGGTLITKKHVLLAAHVPYPATPFILYFVDNNNNAHSYRVIRTKKVGTTDILIGELDAEVSDALKVYSVMPANFRNYLSGSTPVLFSDQQKKALIGNLGPTENTDNATYLLIGPPSLSAFSTFFEPVIVGDSGNPAFTFVNNEPILLGAWYRTWNANSSLTTNVPGYISDINNTISSFGSSEYKLTIADLSGFKPN